MNTTLLIEITNVIIIFFFFSINEIEWIKKTKVVKCLKLLYFECIRFSKDSQITLLYLLYRQRFDIYIDLR